VATGLAWTPPQFVWLERVDDAIAGALEETRQEDAAAATTNICLILICSKYKTNSCASLSISPIERMGCRYDPRSDENPAHDFHTGEP
jgi:hypothetical protein